MLTRIASIIASLWRVKATSSNICRMTQLYVAGQREISLYNDSPLIISCFSLLLKFQPHHLFCKMSAIDSK